MEIEYEYPEFDVHLSAESGEQESVSLPNLAKLAQALEVPAAALIDEREED